jgi:S1-C subfamily serine protease
VDYIPVRISREQIQIGGPISVMGYPAGGNLTLLFGNVSSLNQSDGRIAIATPVAPGQDGSPVLNKNGDVVAVVIGGYVGRSVGIAVPIISANSMLAGTAIVP